MKSTIEMMDSTWGKGKRKIYHKVQKEM